MISNSQTGRGMIRYSSRDYNALMEEFWGLIPKLTELWKPEADADPGVVLGKFLASIADMLGVNLDWLANEVFAPSVTQRKNAEKLFDLIGYKLGWYTAARTEVTFINNGVTDITLDFGFNGSNFATLNAYTDITAQPRVITYNILPMTSAYGTKETRSKRLVTTESINVFASSDPVTLSPGDSVTRVAIEGEIRSYSVSVSDVKKNNYTIKLPSQHVDTTAVWIRAKTSSFADKQTQWVQVSSAAEFITPEPRFAVTYDNYSNAQIQVSNYLNELENYEDNILVIYWIECSGIIGSVGADVLSNLNLAIVPTENSVINNFEESALTISNLSNTIEMPHTHTVAGRSPETAKEAYYNSRKYINTWDSLITVPDFNRFLNREAGVDCGLVIDCQKALEINQAIYSDDNLTEAQKAKMYITYADFPVGDSGKFNWRNILNVDTSKGIPFPCNFKTHIAACYLIHNDFNDSTEYASSVYEGVDIKNLKNSNIDEIVYMRYRAPMTFLSNVNADFRPLQAMSVELDFPYARIFPWFVVGEIYPKTTVSKDVAQSIILKVKEALAIYFAPANRTFGQKPTTMEVVDIIENADPRIKYFDAGGLKNPVINYGEKRRFGSDSKIVNFDIEYFNPISFAKYQDVGLDENNIRINPEWVIK